MARLREIAETTPLVIDANLERPAILTPFTEFAAAILDRRRRLPGGAGGRAHRQIAPLGSLPFEIPRSTDAVRASQSDVADDTEDPVYPARAGLRYEIP